MNCPGCGQWFSGEVPYGHYCKRHEKENNTVKVAFCKHGKFEYPGPCWQCATDAYSRVSTLEAELAALKSRRCGTCRHWHRAEPPHDAHGTCCKLGSDESGFNIFNDARTGESLDWFGCIQWTKKEEP